MLLLLLVLLKQDQQVVRATKPIDSVSLFLEPQNRSRGSRAGKIAISYFSHNRKFKQAFIYITQPPPLSKSRCYLDPPVLF